MNKMSRIIFLISSAFMAPAAIIACGAFLDVRYDLSGFAVLLSLVIALCTVVTSVIKAVKLSERDNEE